MPSRTHDKAVKEPWKPPVVFECLSLDIGEFERNGPAAFNLHVSDRVTAMLRAAGYEHLCASVHVYDMRDWSFLYRAGPDHGKFLDHPKP